MTTSLNTASEYVLGAGREIVGGFRESCPAVRTFQPDDDAGALFSSVRS